MNVRVSVTLFVAGVALWIVILSGFRLRQASMLLFAALAILAGWYAQIALVTPLASRHRDRLVLYLTPPTCLAVLALFLIDWRAAGPAWWGETQTVGFYAGALMLVVAWEGVPRLGLSPHDDVAERRNRGAAWAGAGAMLGVTLAFGGTTGGTLATYPFWLALLLGVVAVAALYALWVVLERLSHFAEAITVERDGGAALRLAAWLTALGLLLGQALQQLLSVSESWQPLSLLAGPAVLLAVAAVLEPLRNRTPVPCSWPRPGDVVVAVAYGVVAVLGTILPRVVP
jgi:hypothetical protein